MDAHEIDLSHVYRKVLYFAIHACLNMCIMAVGSIFGSLAWLCVEFVQD